MMALRTLVLLLFSAVAAVAQPTIGQTFSQATAGLPVVADYMFGTNAIPGPGQTLISGTAQLANAFSAYENNTNTTTINSEWERFQPFSSSANFVFDANDLALTATLNTGSTATPTAYCTITNAGAMTGSGTNAFSDISCPSGSTFVAGQLAAVSYAGVYSVGTVNGTTSFTLGAPAWGGPAAIPSYANGIVFLPAAELQASAVSGNCMTFASVPSVVKVGDWMSIDTGGSSLSSSQMSEVTSVSGTQVCVNQYPGTVGSGSYVVFAPGISSAQLWSNQYYMPTPGHAFAAQVTLTLPSSKGATRNFTPSSIVAGAPYGAWLGFWDFNTSNVPGTYDELDFLETMLNNTQDFTVWTGDNHGNDWDNATGFSSYWPLLFYNNSECGAGSNNWDCMLSFDMSASQITIGVEWAYGYVFRYVNGQLIRAEHYDYSTPSPAQLGIDLATGTWLNSLAANFGFPFSSAEFPYSLKVSELKVFQQ